jgi:DNA topoisomerase-3
MLEQVPPQTYDPSWKLWRWETLPMVPPNNLFKTAVKDSCKAQLAVLKGLYSKSDVLVNACDAGREGELIFWEIVRHCGWGAKKYPPALGEKPYFRFWAQSNTAEGLLEAWQKMKPGEDWLGLASSAYCRSEADWLLGMNVSRAATLAFPVPLVDGKRGFWSVGRVQTPVLSLVADRDDQIEKFVSEPYYEVRLGFGSERPFEATLLVPKGVTPFDLEAKDPKCFLRKPEAQEALRRVEESVGSLWEVEDEVKEGKENPPALFSLTELQKWCNQSWGWEAKRTLDAAQSAYEEAKTLSYPRTDSSFLPEDSVEKMGEVYLKVSQYVLSRVSESLEVFSPGESPRRDWLFDNSKISDHYAIVPTGEVPRDLESDAGRVWLAVVRRFLVAFSAPALYSTVKRRLTFVGELRDVAVASGKVYSHLGWLAVERGLAALTGAPAKSQPEELPRLDSPSVVLSGVRLHEGKTTPPKHYTEASLLASMENIHTRLGSEEEELKEVMSRKGIGTPATRAAIIELLLGRGYMQRVKKGSTGYLKVTEEGSRLVRSLRSSDLGALTEPLLTAEWEQKLLSMERGNYSRQTFMKELLEMVLEAVGALRSSASEGLGDSPGLCPVSGGAVLDKGSFWEFPGYPNARFYKTVASRQMSFEEICEVLSGSERIFDGFVSKKGAKFSAGLKWDKEAQRLSFSFAGSREKVVSELCPRSGEPIRDCGGFWEFPGLAAKFWKTMAKRPMRLDEYISLARDGKTAVLDGFVSTSSGKSFSASLVLEPSGKVTFSFPPRGWTPTSPGMSGPGKSPKKKG